MNSKKNNNRIWHYYSNSTEGRRYAEDILESLHKTNGEIDESLKIVSHSMGGAYAKGYVNAILDYAKGHNIAGVIVAFEADFAPFQPKKQKAVKDKNMGPTLQFSHSSDNVAGNDPMPGADQMDTSKDTDQGHAIVSFTTDDILNLPAGSYKIINGKIVR
ncbi:MAG: hypothetical protein EPN39_21205 [Chitinophagaceae bacterium]|jgi:hypothetical protein|nr:MAG: hypothetical protein EPN39_21205 [Chitinophagaceae bacterium]